MWTEAPTGDTFHPKAPSPSLPSIPPGPMAHIHASGTDRSPPREVQLPAQVLGSLDRQGGRAAGHWLAGVLRASLGTDDLGRAPSDRFWSALDEALADRGWGSMRQERLHSGLGVIVAEGWVEAEHSDGCPFTSGLLEALFGEVAGHAIEVVETDCSSGATDAPGQCRFVFGGAVAVSALRDHLEGGASEAEAVAAI